MVAAVPDRGAVSGDIDRAALKHFEHGRADRCRAAGQKSDNGRELHLVRDEMCVDIGAEQGRVGKVRNWRAGTPIYI